MRSVVVVAFVGALLAVAASAQASIVPDVSIGGARWGMTEKQLRAALGAPRSTLSTDPKTKELAYRTVTAVLYKGIVLGLTTKAPSEKMAGTTIGVGSTETKLRQTVKGLKCVVNFGTRVCNLVRSGRKLSEPYTRFNIDAGRVSRISILRGAPLTQSG